MELYAGLRPGTRVFAACLAEGNETAHRWQVFADRGQGASIRFDQDRLCAAAARLDILHGPMSYVQWRDLSPVNHLRNRLPFVKRQVFRFEREYRFVALTQGAPAAQMTLNVSIPLDCMTAVNLSGELPAPLVESVVKTICAIPGCKRIRVRQSGFLQNKNWSRSIADLVNQDPSWT